MKRYINYFKYVMRHKYYVFKAGLELGVPIWQLILHDWDKFTPLQFVSYAKAFYNNEGTPKYKPHAAFWRGWNAHQKNNKHHWQHWCLYTDKGVLEALPIPNNHRREMLADWIGAGRAQGKPNTKEWYDKNATVINIHTETRKWIEDKLKELYDGK